MTRDRSDGMAKYRIDFEVDVDGKKYLFSGEECNDAELLKTIYEGVPKHLPWGVRISVYKDGKRLDTDEIMKELKTYWYIEQIPD